MQTMTENVVVMDLAAGNVDGMLGGKRKKLTGDERLRRNRERNRMHARKTRERKKLQSQVLQTRINELHAGKGNGCCVPSRFFIHGIIILFVMVVCWFFVFFFALQRVVVYV